MTIKKNSGRQELIVATLDFAFSDLTSGADLPAIDLPHNAVVTGGDVVVTTAFNSATSDVLDVGDSASENRYLNDANLASAGRTALAPTGYVVPNDSSITVRWVGTGTAPTAGAARLTVHYYVKNRAAFSQG